SLDPTAATPARNWNCRLPTADEARIPKAENPADLPVRRRTKYELAIHARPRGRSGSTLGVRARPRRRGDGVTRTMPACGTLRRTHRAGSMADRHLKNLAESATIDGSVVTAS